MAGKVKVYRSGDKGIEVEEVDIEAAKRIVEQARGQGRCVVDKKIGQVIEDLNPNTEELLIVDILEGG